VNKENETKISRHIFTIRLRALVLALGETADPAWWKTEFMNETGLRFLERLYPRTPVRAALHAAGRAACEAHDKAVGRVGVYHLFRLPDSLESEMHAAQSSEDEEFINQFRSCLGRSDDLLDMLSKLCTGPPAKGVAAGPKRIGSASDAAGIDALGTAASIYHEAFKRGKPAFPYFSSEQDRMDG
jgi:hypothetical protein